MKRLRDEIHPSEDEALLAEVVRRIEPFTASELRRRRVWHALEQEPDRRATRRGWVVAVVAATLVLFIGSTVAVAATGVGARLVEQARALWRGRAATPPAVHGAAAHVSSRDRSATPAVAPPAAPAVAPPAAPAVAPAASAEASPGVPPGSTPSPPSHSSPPRALGPTRLSGPSLVTSTPATSSAPGPSRPSRSIAHASSGAASEVRLAPETAESLLVVNAVNALRGDRDPRRAARLLEDYLVRYPDGTLTEEALALAVEAAVAGEQPDDVVRAARRYLARYSAGRYRRYAERALVEPDVDDPKAH